MCADQGHCEQEGAFLQTIYGVTFGRNGYDLPRAGDPFLVPQFPICAAQPHPPHKRVQRLNWRRAVLGQLHHVIDTIG